MGDPFRTVGNPGEYDPANYIGPTAAPGAPPPPPAAAVGAPPEGMPYPLYPYLPPAFMVETVLLGKSTPGASTTLTYTVPAGCLGMVQSAFFNYSADATVGARIINVEYFAQNGVDHFIEMAVNTTAVTAGTNKEFALAANWPVNYVTGGGASIIHQMIPALWLPPLGQFQLATGGTTGAGDFFQFVALSVLLMPQPFERMPAVGVS